ncbi:MAG: hypothetical protein P4L50_03100 [Anaerolineaceae bacterium]|nr:hypothetical protein [Anaerolineaceae bacterium]
MIFNVGFDLKKTIDNLPAGLDREVLRIISFHQGRTKSISRTDLQKQLALNGWHQDERSIREQINLLRKQGYLICSTGGKSGGYWWAINWQELSDYLDNEIASRINDLRETEHVMRKSARERFGPPDPQMRLI